MRKQPALLALSSSWRRHPSVLSSCAGSRCNSARATRERARVQPRALDTLVVYGAYHLPIDCQPVQLLCPPSAAHVARPARDLAASLTSHDRGGFRRGVCGWIPASVRARRLCTPVFCAARRLYVADARSVDPRQPRHTGQHSPRVVRGQHVADNDAAVLSLLRSLLSLDCVGANQIRLAVVSHQVHAQKPAEQTYRAEQERHQTSGRGLQRAVLSCCTERSTSISTSLVLISVDFIQTALSLYDLNCLLVDLAPLIAKMMMRNDEFTDTVLFVRREFPLTAKPRHGIRRRF